MSYGISKDNFKIHDEKIYVYTASASEHSRNFFLFKSVLSSVELERADRYHFERDRTRYVIGRGLLRIHLSEYLNVDPKDIMFEYNPWGKPRIANELNRTKIAFNLSHSEDIILFAISFDKEIGIDIELIKPVENIKEIIMRFATEVEKEIFLALPEIERLGSFYRWWTRKEAVMKATGKGLLTDITKFSVSFESDKPPCILFAHDDAKYIEQYLLVDLLHISGYAGALVY